MTSFKGQKSTFFFQEDDERRPPARPPAFRSATSLAVPLSRTTLRASDSAKIDDILLFPVENSHAYSYARLSPNSLALRLNVLKRSLEILNERPDWMRLMNSVVGRGQIDEKAPSQLASLPTIDSNTKLNNFKRSAFLQPLHASQLSQLSQGADKYKLSSNASSAALSALFRPKLSRLESQPVSRIATETGPLNVLNVATQIATLNDDSFPDDLKDIISLIENDGSSSSSKSEIAATLHDLSLSSGLEEAERKQNLLKTKLLFALATPFVESSVMTTSLLSASTGGTSASLSSSPSMAALNMLGAQNPSSSSAPGSRPFHAISSGKHSSPQSIVTVDADFPWNFKAANDLACLMFGVSKSMIRNLTLMDLIAPQFRNFVTEKMNRAIAGELEQSPTGNKNIIFAGEIIAISRQAEGGFAWTSIWAQKKGNLIICMFEQITCDAFDLTLSVDVEKYNTEPYTIKAIDEVAGSLISKLGASGIKKLDSFSESLSEDLRILSSKNVGDDECENPDFVDSECLCNHRYYTLQLNGDENIPCALSLYPLERDETKFELKIKIHAMPYIAGMFVVDFSNYEVLSCNKAIAKNLFGFSSENIIGHLIDTVIPDFSHILQAGLDDQDEPLEIISGLVLPEHFFRKYHAVLKETRINGSKSSMEDIFLSSRGIEGIHRDGKTLFIDIQLRVILPDIFVLWVTYSRHSGKNITQQLQKLSHSASSLALEEMQSHGLHSSGKSSAVDVPSQMKLFHEKDILELGGNSSNEVSRQSSTRRPKKASTFAVPVTYISDQSLSIKGRGGLRALSVSDARSDSIISDDSNEKNDSLDTAATTNTNTSENRYYQNFSEDEILDLENKEIESIKSQAKLWPTKIGEKKRSKKFEEFKILKKMGEGAYGKVVLAEHKDDPAYKIIIKCIDKQRILVDTWVRDRQLGTVPSEIQVMATLNNEPHPNIMRIIDYFEDTNYYYLETPIFGHPPAIDLFDYIEVKNDMSELDCQLIYKQVILAVYHLHKQGIAHRDIKDENIIVNEFGIVKLIDFGSAGYVKLGPFDVFVGTIDYASPEVLRGEKYEGRPQDIWALGILLYTMIYKENPFYNVDEIMEGDLRVPYVVSDALLELIKKILVREIKARPTITDIAELDWLDV
ncbi:hypothetical protein PUMCH_003752 [Australozyma saopauloensis]|uniref:non-specific serine/threonine protein kinase n=1 Tax=Australozyma saopauloensis TaxID=291208 RepID=A0AAX4HCS1_9ASCO|nr:hypothetical protein PUMCH_003752 [[Candida] saopauloensis]